MADSSSGGVRKHTTPAVARHASKTADSEGQRFRPAKVVLALPAYNEQEALPELLERIGEAFADSRRPYEVVVIDDGSTDDSWKATAMMWNRNPPIE